MTLLLITIFLLAFLGLHLEVLLERIGEWWFPPVQIPSGRWAAARGDFLFTEEEKITMLHQRDRKFRLENSTIKPLDTFEALVEQALNEITSVKNQTPWRVKWH